MKIKPKLDRRPEGEYQKIDDREWNALCRTAGLSRKQQILVGAYCDKQMKRKIDECVSATKYGAIAFMREQYEWGRKRLIRMERGITSIVNDAYGKECLDANGKYQSWDGCGIEHLKQRLKRDGIDVERED